jgi:dihydrofolate reductase
VNKQRLDMPSPLRGAIAAMTRDNIIGIDGGLPWRYSDDLKRFKQRTMGSAIIMGRVTWDSIGQRQLSGRRNIVISRSTLPDVEHYNDVHQAFDACQDQDLWVIGGGQIYRASMPWLNLLDITYVPDVIRRQDVIRFPRIDPSCWTAVEEQVLPGDSGLTNIIYHRSDSD